MSDTFIVIPRGFLERILYFRMLAHDVDIPLKELNEKKQTFQEMFMYTMKFHISLQMT